LAKKISYIGSVLLYYLIVYPLSLLPLRVIYLFTDVIYLIFTYVFPYREKVIRKNLYKSFPQASRNQRKKIRQAFYKHFTDLLAESIKNISISERQLKKRFKVSNYKIINELYKKKKSVLLVSGHYNNWEWMITAQNILFKHQAIGVGMPLSNTFWNKKLNQRRARFGMEIIDATQVKQTLSRNTEKPTATLLLSDQAPPSSEKAFWMSFLNQQTPILFGCEQLAHEFNQAVVFFVINKRKRGYYKIDLHLITDNPQEMNWGEITKKHAQLLERKINQKPEFWLWSHNRWKREIPKNLEQLKKIQEEKFYNKFKKKKKSFEPQLD
jgi:KDO2-lipid IV(A) lauroyltransferase